MGPGVAIKAVAGFWGAFLGTCTHVALDSIMHVDLEPLAPISQRESLALARLGRLAPCVLRRERSRRCCRSGQPLLVAREELAAGPVALAAGLAKTTRG
jgi:hypothetical protein